LPLINIWAQEFKKTILDIWKEFEFKQRSFNIVNTIDIDNAWAYLNKGGLRISGALAKATGGFKLNEVGDRIAVLSGKRKDPYDSYQFLKEFQEKNKLKTIYFFLLGKYGPFDKNIPARNKQLKKLIKEISSYAQVGIHPSYASFKSKEKQKNEKDLLRSIIGEEVTRLRKHFLRLDIPESYRIMADVGITDDYTMGYADHFGFRASICTPYRFFDIINDQMLNVVVHPFMYMDGTLNEYLKISIDEALKIVQKLKSQVKEVDGEFIGIWHNDTVAEVAHWVGWRKVYESSSSM
jgi:hypothetical protein